MSIDPRIPEVIRPIVKEYILLTDKRLLGLINASYIIGSIALGEFNEHFSDIDFIAILNRKATRVEIQHLGKIHQTLEDAYRWKLSGSYIQLRDLGKPGDDIEPHPHFHDAIFHHAAQRELNLITWWELKNRGIPILGSEPPNLPFTVDWHVLMAEMRENMNSYWLSWTRRPRRILLMCTDWGVQWAVLGVLRQFYTFRENSITTKLRAANYALAHLPSQWHPLIQEAINIRQGENGSVYRFRFGRMRETIHFLKYIITTCNQYSIL